MYLHIVISVVLIIETIDCATSTVQTEGVPAVCSGGENSEVKSEDVLSSCICDKYYLLWPSDKVLFTLVNIVKLSSQIRIIILTVMDILSEMLQRVHSRSLSRGP